MKPCRITSMVLTGLMVACAASAAKAPSSKKSPDSDLASIEARREVVESAVNVAKLEVPPALPDSLPQPFNPPGFDRETSSETRTTPGVAAAPTRPAGDRELLAAIASRVTPAGTFFFGGERYLQFSKKRLKVGDRLTVTYEGLDCTLELTAIDATNFTLRLNREEITRPIKPGKTQ